ncbi:MAG: NAD(P)H-dependent oxidoreductase [Campylobacteraceae bacterium]|nr:NAD(P)H-dependent oxidoreductase [Campylobacteraceae bacterium]
MNILIISCSQRDESKSLELTNYIEEHIFRPNDEVDTTILDLSLYPFLLDYYGKGREDAELLTQNKKGVLNKLYACDSIVFVSPEWGGMIPPALVNLLLLSAYGSASGLPLGNKPAFVVGVSASGGGGNVVSLLKAYSAKNSHLVWLPLHAVVQNVEEFLEKKWQPQEENRFSKIQSRLETGLKSLLIYSSKLQEIREELLSLSIKHPYGQ